MQYVIKYMLSLAEKAQKPLSWKKQNTRLISWCHVEWYVYVSLFSIKWIRRSCGLRKVRYDTNECLVANLDGQLFATRVTQRVLLMEQELLALPKHPRWPPVISGVCVARSLVFNVLFYRSLMVLLSFFFLPLYF